ncbi:hypothetical protein QOZ80_6AG0543050 [Eleusine coracana subsp. coracana]|nr:hypothetical protein QOZ80_6AG0543050 [Eleusine coracana subsp. coracana]
MDSQSEWILLRRVYAFLKSRNLKAAARALEKEAGLKFDFRRLPTLFEDGRWRRVDQYVSAFMRGREDTPDACRTLFPIRIQRLVRALKRGDRAWADRYRDRRVLPLLPHHPDQAAADAELRRAMRCADEGRLHVAYPDCSRYRRQRFVDFLRNAGANRYIYSRSDDPLDYNLKMICKITSLSLRRCAPRRRRKAPSPA